MQELINMLSAYCVNKGIIDEEAVPWFKYGVEKRLTSLLVGIPFFMCAVLLSNLSVAISFHLSFFLLRRRINGVHAKNIWLCLSCSLLFAIILLGLLRHLFNSLVVYITLLVCLILVFILAPYDHPNMNMTSEEVNACRMSARLCSVTLTLIAVVMELCEISSISVGISLGIALAVFFLCLAYIFDGGIQNDQYSGEDK